MAFDFKTVGKNDQVALVAGAVAVLLTFFPWYAKLSVKAEGVGILSGGGSESYNAWHGWATIGSLLIAAAFAIVVLRVVVGNVLPDGAPWHLITAALAALGTLLLLIYPFTAVGPSIPSGVPDSVDISKLPGWSGWLLLITAIVFAVFAALNFKESGEKIPEINKKDTPPAPPAA